MNENKLLAENRFTLNRELFYEGMRQVIWANSGLSRMLLVAALGILWLVLLICSLAMGEGLAITGLELLAIVLAALWALLWLPRRKARRAFQALEAKGAADTERITRFFEDDFEVDVSGQRTRISYDDLKNILNTRNLLIFLTKDGTGVMVGRDSFTYGSESDVMRWIDDRGTEAQNHD